MDNLQIRSDRIDPVILTLKRNELTKGRGLLKLNYSPVYVKLIKLQTPNTFVHYVLQVDRGDALHGIDILDIQFAINDQ